MDQLYPNITMALDIAEAMVPDPATVNTVVLAEGEQPHWDGILAQNGTEFALGSTHAPLGLMDAPWCTDYHANDVPQH